MYWSFLLGMGWEFGMSSLRGLSGAVTVLGHSSDKSSRHPGHIVSDMVRSARRIKAFGRGWVSFGGPS